MSPIRSLRILLKHSASQDTAGNVHIHREPTTTPSRSTKDRCLHVFMYTRPTGNDPDARKQRRRLKPLGVCFLSLLVIVFIAGIILVAVLVPRRQAEAPGIKAVVDLGYSQYEGRTLSSGISQWLGIRYGQNPIGELRFREAKDPLNVTRLQSATKHGPQCMSTSTRVLPTQSEDCLFLDVYCPANSDNLLPVYVFVQGGGFNSLTNPDYNGSGLITASNNTICIVTFNYRVGLYGFLTSREVVAGGDTNIGLKDQRKVLQWVQNNIAKFGGDPSHVVLGGDSAGAASVAAQLTAYGGRDDNLFHATAAQSTSFGPKFNISSSQYQYDALVARIGCNKTMNSLACLRAKTVARLQAVNIQIPTPGRTKAPLFMYGPVVDGNFTQDTAYSSFAGGKYIKLPAIWGSDTNDGTIFAPRSINSSDALSSFLSDQFPNLTEPQTTRINMLYPKDLQFANSGHYWRSAANAYGDMRYLCSSLYTSTQTKNSSSNNIPTYTYRYNVVDPNDARSGYGAKHTVEMSAIWGPRNVPGAPASYSTIVNAAIVPIMQGYWTSFIRTYDPNVYKANNAPDWEVFQHTKYNRIKLETNTTSMETVDTDQLQRCKYFWEIGKELDQ